MAPHTLCFLLGFGLGGFCGMRSMAMLILSISAAVSSSYFNQKKD
jgi:hypothetical protein